MAWLHRETARVLTTVVLFAAVAAFVYGARRTLIAFVFAILFAYLLEPLVASLETKRVASASRGVAIVEVYVLLLFVLAVAGYFGGPALAIQARKLTEALPGFADRLTSGQIAWQIGASRGWTYETQERLQHFLQAHRQGIMNFAGSWGSRVAAFAANSFWLVLIPILSIFFLKDGRRMAETVIATFDRVSQRAFLRGVIEDMNEMLAGYIRAQLILAALSMIVYTGALLLFRVPYAVALGVAAGMMEFIPVVGPFVAAVAIVGVALLSNYPHILWLVVFLGVWRLMQDYVNSPRLMSGKTELSPLAVIFAVLAGGEIAGVIGVYLSIPVMAGVGILWRRYQRYVEAQEEAPPDPRSTLRAA